MLLSTIGLAKRLAAMNVSRFDEVPDSSWFTHRIGRYPMSQRQLARGPNKGTGPNMKGPWHIRAAKTEGLTPGLVIEDSRGDTYVIKFDPPGYQGLSSGAEIISTKILYASGYEVPENYIVEFDWDMLVLDEDATTRDRYDREIKLEPEAVANVHNRVEKGSNGKYRALASKYLAGQPLGPFAFWSRRLSDKNDQIPHEHRRELRGYDIFAAWLNHGDSRAANTLDTFIVSEADGTGYVKHHLIDFGDTIGSAGIGPKSKDHLYDYRLNYGKVLVATAGLGFYKPYWENAKSTDNVEVGFFESELFEPHKWRPTYPNPAFQNMTPRDGFWGAKIVMRFSDEDIRKIVEQAQYKKPESVDYITKHLIARRDKIGQYYFTVINPLDNFQLVEPAGRSAIAFEDLAIVYRLATPDETVYRYKWRAPKGTANLSDWALTEDTTILIDDKISEQMAIGKEYGLRIQTKRNRPGATWSPSVDVYVTRTGDELELKGLSRRY